MARPLQTLMCVRAPEEVPLTHVASDPAVQRPQRAEPAPVRTGAADKSGAVEGMLDSAQDAARTARAERPARTRSPERSETTKPSDRPAPRTEARDATNDAAPAGKSDSKPATAPDTRQAKNGQPTDSQTAE